MRESSPGLRLKSRTDGSNWRTKLAERERGRPRCSWEGSRRSGFKHETRRDGMGGWMDWLSGGSGGRAMDAGWSGVWLRARRGIFLV